jgi:hypothetical protein
MVRVSLKDHIHVELPFIRLGQADWLFFLVAPLAIALLLGWHFAGFGRQLSQVASIILWALTIGAWWMVAELGVRLLAPVMVRIGMPFWTAVLAAAAIALVTSPYYTNPIMGLIAHIDGVEMSVANLPQRDYLDAGYLLILAKSGFIGFIYWGGLRIVYERMRSRPSAEPTLPPASPERPFSFNPTAEKLRTLTRKQGLMDIGAIIAVEAEDHYVRLHTRDRNLLVLMPFVEAIRAFDAVAGFRTHRSYWVREAAILEFQDRDGKSTVRMEGGLIVPVSRRYRELLRHSLYSAGR